VSGIIAGLLTGFSLIVAIGAQNAYVLRMGLAKAHITLIVTLCTASDAVLIALGIGGLGRIFTALPQLLTIFKWVGVAYLLFFAFSCVRRALGAAVLMPGESPVVKKSGVVLTTLSLTFLNPHVYLDTVLLIGSIGNQYGAHRWWFGLGAALASALWFSGLGFGARYMSKWMARPATWRVLDLAIALVMVIVAVRLATLHIAR
jgi:L-lysine exporter family protein LysE/ArgO